MIFWCFASCNGFKIQILGESFLDLLKNGHFTYSLDIVKWPNLFNMFNIQNHRRFNLCLLTDPYAKNGWYHLEVILRYLLSSKYVQGKACPVASFWLFLLFLKILFFDLERWWLKYFFSILPLVVIFARNFEKLIALSKYPLHLNKVFVA